MKNKQAIPVSLLVVALVVLSVALIRLQGRYTELAEKVKTHDRLYGAFGISEYSFAVPEKKPFEIHLLATDTENQKQKFGIWIGSEKQKNVIIRGMRDFSGEQYFMVETAEEGSKTTWRTGPISLRGCLPEDMPEDEYKNIKTLFNSNQQWQLTGFGDMQMYDIGEKVFGFAVTNKDIHTE